MFTIETPVEKLVMIGPAYQNRLKKLGITTIGDLLYHLPFRYDDFSLISTIEKLQEGERVSVVGTVKKIENVYTKSRKKIQKAIVSDSTGSIDVIWYNQPFLTNILKPETTIILSGVVSSFASKLIFESPSYEMQKEKIQPLHTARFVPVYPETASVSSKWLRSRIFSLLSKFPLLVEDPLPQNIIQKYSLVPQKRALEMIHFPKNGEEARIGRRRLAFDELFFVQLRAAVRRKLWEKEQVSQPLFVNDHLAKIKQVERDLPFTLTNSQRRVLREIFADLSKTRPMNRLLVGDVGSGKTVVAAIAMYVAFLSGFQSILLAPTEILAKQHYKTIQQVLGTFIKRIELVTAETKKSVSRTASIFVGTHALLSQSLELKHLGLAVIDEQQRFGVRQRAILRLKGTYPHLLSMTATPIPRTIALTLFADLDVSFLEELPHGRSPVKTWVVPPHKRENAYAWIRNHIHESKGGNRVFIVCPFIEESQTMTEVKAAKAEFERLRTHVFPEFSLGLLHGGLNEKKRSEVLSAFRKGKYNILVSTPIIEVGIDIPTATIILIEGAERFGLSQLHQLRGRVGRGSTQSYCLLFTYGSSIIAMKRLTYLTQYSYGPKLAELDMQLRGSGEIFGLKQHGHLGLTIATIADVDLLQKARESVGELLTRDPLLSRFPLLRKKTLEDTIEEIAPD
ncbi:ATP-dependent DNA helicase RecG [Candidatus Gottesmanbacteria bacterium]|nr:ATP-dependent DNA helicase RecG [Candidatus Gottesmanbacteria bacterium]